MICYFNLGFLPEQALVDVFKTYIDRLNLDEVYKNYHISVTNEHPFAHIIIEPNARAADNFPSIVITTVNDNSVSEMSGMPVQISVIAMNKADITELVNSCLRDKKKIDSDGEIVDVKKGGVTQKEKIPGKIFIYDENRINALKDLCDERTTTEKAGNVYGMKFSTRRTDRISIEIWSENNQLKNELYEQLRLLVSTSLDFLMNEKYKDFEPSIKPNSVSGQRSNNYNFDFDVLLFGSNITFEIDYNIDQYVIDTEIEYLHKDIVLEVESHVKAD